MMGSELHSDNFSIFAFGISRCVLRVGLRLQRYKKKIIFALKIQEFIDEILTEFGFRPTRDQLNALETFARFLADRGERRVMLLRGSAGTGKTSLAGAMVRTFARFGQKLQLMAPTGRAAKVFATNSGRNASTIHRKIYRERRYTGIGGAFDLNDNLNKDTLFIVDEASMIGTGAGAQSIFGTGSLLDDLVRYVYSGPGCSMMLIGDSAQLPPVGEVLVPALDVDALETRGLTVYACDLREVLRQGHDSGILFNATHIRCLSPHVIAANGLPRIRFSGFADVVAVTGADLPELIAASYAEVGVDETIIVTRSNKLAGIYNQGIRATVLDHDDMLCTGDRLMIVKNKYLDKAAEAAGQLSFIANGDRAEVMRVSNLRECHGFRFADVCLRFPDYHDHELTQTVMLDTLTSDAPALPEDKQRALFEAVMADYTDLSRKRDRLEALRRDVYFNALQIKYAYAVTCHKAQGGQWAHVYLDQGRMAADMPAPDYARWLYTAFTRATQRIFLVNWPKTQTDDRPPI